MRMTATAWSHTMATYKALSVLSLKHNNKTHTGTGHVNSTDTDEKSDNVLMDASFGGLKYMCAHIHNKKNTHKTQ